MATLSIKVIIFKSKIYILLHKIGLATFNMLLKITQTVAGLLKNYVAISSTFSVLLIRLLTHTRIPLQLFANFVAEPVTFGSHGSSVHV